MFEIPSRTGQQGVAPVQAWYATEIDQPLEENPWDAAHMLGRGDAAFSAAGVSLVEPDLEQSAFPTSPARTDLLQAVADPCFKNPQDRRLPRGATADWHLGTAYSQLADARAAVADRGGRVVIAHLDTGFDPDHHVMPTNMDFARQRNFTGEGRLDDARDRAVLSQLTNRGHGHATLGLLAGSYRLPVEAAEPLGDGPLGGAPMASVIPIRVANAVAVFWTSAIAKGIAYATDMDADVLSLSMGGVASFAWADAVNRAYERGMVMVAAAGNNYGHLPTRHIVHPARFQRVIAACGLMADHRPYDNRQPDIMQGNHGPLSKMNTALAAFTPNVPWTKFGCGGAVGLHGSGTSSATPQIAAAAALWILAHREKLNAYPEPWMRGEAVRQALFASGAIPSEVMTAGEAQEKLGRGMLQAMTALGVEPMAAEALRKPARDSALFAAFRVLTGLGITGETPRAAMLALEMTQLSQTGRSVQDVLADPDAPHDVMSDVDRRRYVEAMLDERRISRTLRSYLDPRTMRSPPAEPPKNTGAPPQPGQVERRIVRSPPAERRLRIFASDPSFAGVHETAHLSEVVVSVPWEGAVRGHAPLQPGPVGEYLEVVDIDPASGCAYAPVDLDDPYLLATNGLPPSESNPQFHQQMVYAVAMTTIRNFEQALGRVALWAPERRMWARKGQKAVYDDFFVRRLRIYPHGLREANAYYSPRKKALMFGYFPAAPSTSGSTVPGSTVFTCLSHDIIAHEVTHALLDGLHRRYQEATNPDMPAFHEAFADIVAIFQHFSLPGLLEQELKRTAGDLGKGGMLAELARQFGEGIGRSAALRSAIGQPAGEVDYRNLDEPHDRGAILLAAVFAAFLTIYRSRSADLHRIAVDAGGTLRPGSMHPDLLRRLADEARKSAAHVLRMCIRALDYCPPVDLTFGDYLRALITSDADLVPDDRFGYRVAFLEAFRSRGIYPDDLRTVSTESLRWQEPTIPLEGLSEILADLDLSWDLDADRARAAASRAVNGGKFHDWLEERLTPALAAQLGLRLNLSPGGQDGASGRCQCRRPDPETAKSRFEVHSIRPARRVAPDGSFLTDLVVILTQRRCECLGADDISGPGYWQRGGCTLLIDTRKGRERVRYCISKRIDAPARIARAREFSINQGGSLRGLYFGDDLGEPFAMLHRGH
ncbi:MAG: S8 family serine peptidase [Alphaproteobacteria bacterium]|jgi:hypothetical protein|nr:S8 family serine peptidase [Brevundimonas sp.]MBU2419151.1 S8 family serine peptidase [Alphaproteobacteria bacterium]